MRITNKNKDRICGDLQTLSTILDKSNDNPNCREVQYMVSTVISYAAGFELEKLLKK